MKATKVLLTLTILLMAETAARANCPPQIYDDQKVQPDYGCRSPGEELLIPDLEFNPSIGMDKGSSVLLPGKKTLTLEYDAVLVDKNKILDLGMRIKGLRKLRWLDFRFNKQLYDAERSAYELRAKTLLDYEKNKVADRDRVIDELKKETRWYRSWPIGCVIGSVLTAVILTTVVVVSD